MSSVCMAVYSDIYTLQSRHINWEVHYTEVVFVEGLFCTPRCLAFVSQEGFHFNSTSLHVVIVHAVSTKLCTV